jgi:hypothetical protein
MATPSTARGHALPDLIRYQLRNGPYVSEPTTDRGEIEQLARTCQAGHCLDGLDSAVIETRFTIVRALMPSVVTTVRTLRDYLPPPMARSDPPEPAVIAPPTSLL